MSLSRKVITDIDAVNQFRNILYYTFRISNSGIIFLVLFYLLPGIGFGLISIKVIILILIIAAALFTSYIFYILLKEKRHGWIVIYFITIPLPLIAGYLIFKGTLAFETALLLPLLSFYLYCYLIKYAIDDWIREYNWTQQLMKQNEESAERREDELSL